jgi:hypothetical protein
MWTRNPTQRFDDDDSRMQVETKVHTDDVPATESYRNPVRMFAVAMNMRRLAHSRKASLSAQAR